MSRPWPLLRSAPVAVPCAVAVAVLAWWAADGAGYQLTTWAPGTVLIVALVGLALTTVPGGWPDAPGAVRVAVGALGAFTAWSYLSILWAGHRGDAWEGADRTLLYLALFTLFALWRQRGATAAFLLGGWVAAIIVVALVCVVRIRGGEGAASLFVSARFAGPAGYPNAAAAGLLMALWPAVALAASGRVNPIVRGGLAGGAVLVAGLTLLCQSRGSVLALPLTALVFLAAVPGRLRHGAVLLAVAAGVAVSVPGLLDLTDALEAAPAGAWPRDGDVAGRAMGILLLGAAVVGALVAVAGVVHARNPPAPKTIQRTRRAGAVAAACLAVALVVGGLAVAGNPVNRARSAWSSFKGGYNEQQEGSRFVVSGLGSNRYDFYRVAVRAFAGSPVRGVGADNFQQDYLARGHSPETPRYPHSVELRTLAQTGLVGTLLLAVALAAALTAGLRAAYARRGAGAAVAAGGLGTFAYWLVHGSADWFWEFAGLGGAAFALLGLACGLAPRAGDADGAGARLAPTVPGRAAGAAVLVWAVVGAGVVLLPWLAQRDVENAGAVFAADPGRAYARLERAARLNPLADRPALVEGSIAVRTGDLPRADRAFAAALDRTPRGSYATLQRAALASADGRRRDAVALLRRARRLAPRDPIVREASAVVTSGGRLDVVNLNRRILVRADNLLGG
jgi:hypothetical protein